MKKTYTAPKAEVILISSSDILMLSLNQGSDSGDNNVVDWGTWDN